MPAVNEVRGSQVDDLSRDVARAREPSRVVSVRRLTPIPPMRPLFSDSLLDTSAPERKRRGLAAVLSFTFCIVYRRSPILPLIYTDALPKLSISAMTPLRRSDAGGYFSQASSKLFLEE